MHNSRKIIKLASFYVFASLFAFFALLPFFWMLFSAFKENGALIIVPIQWLPKPVSLFAFEQIFNIVGGDLFTRSMLNSTFVSISITVITILSASMAAFVFAKFKFRNKERLFAIFLATMMIPSQVTTIPIYLVMSNIGLVDKFTGLIITSIFNAFAVFLLRQSMAGIHNDYMDAAIIDGSSYFGVYRNVMLPLCKPILISLGVITFMGAWNDYFWPLVLITSTNKFTLPLALARLREQYQSRHNILMAGALISMLPILVIYFFAQKYFETGLQVGGLKA